MHRDLPAGVSTDRGDPRIAREPERYIETRYGQSLREDNLNYISIDDRSTDTL